MITNPFPGPMPYRASDRERFYGREDLAHKLEAGILANRCVTVHGPSGAGKSSLVQAAVLPTLVESQDVRVVRVDSWPEGESPARWLALALFSDLRLGDLPEDVTPGEAVLSAAKRAARGSPRLMIVYLDQIEQLFYTGRTAEETEPFFACLQDLAELPLRTVRVVLSLREDYLGRFRDRLRDRGRVLDNTFRVGPLTVAELTASVCQAAAAGAPPQAWDADQMRTLMLQVRAPGQAASDAAEAQSAYAQIVCRALFQQRAQGEAADDDAVEAAPILRRYLETTLSDLGALRETAQLLLEDHLVTEDGSRTLRTEHELMRIVPTAKLSPILKALEGAAILHAEEHQGSRYFEIGHDWLARKVFEQRQEREAQEEQRRREAERQCEREIQEKEAAKQLARARKQRRTLGIIAVASIVFAAVTSVLWYVAAQAERAARVAEKLAKEARREAQRKRVDAHDQGLIASYLALTSRGETAYAMKLLPEVKHPAARAGWVSYASDALSSSSLLVTLQGHTAPLSTVMFSLDSKLALTASLDGTTCVWKADGTGQPTMLTGHKDSITSAVFSPDGKRVLTTSDDSTAHVWSADGKATPVELKGGTNSVLSGAFSPDGKRVVLGGDDGIARVYEVGGGGLIELAGHKARINHVAFLPDGLRVVTASDDKHVLIWTVDAKTPPVELGSHKGPARSFEVSDDGTRIVTLSGENLARLFVLKDRTVSPARELKCVKDDKDTKDPGGEAVDAAISADGKLVALACGNKIARVFNADVKDAPPVVLDGFLSGVTSVAFSKDARFLATTASRDPVARVYPVKNGSSPLLLRGHTASLGSIQWSPDDASLITAAADLHSNDNTAKIWRTERLKLLGQRASDAGFFHAASLRADGEFLVATFDDGATRLRRVDGEGEPVVFKGREGREGWLASVALSPRGDRVVTAGFDKKARVWSADGKGEPVVLEGHTGDLHCAAFSVNDDGKRVVTAGEDRTVRVWSADTGKELSAPFSGHEDWITSAAFSPDGTRVVTSSYDQTARVWSVDGKSPPVVLKGHRGAVSSATFDPAGKRVVTASEDGAVSIWSADGTGDPIVLRVPGTGVLLNAVFSGDGTRIAVASDSGLIYVWRADGTGAPIMVRGERPALALTFVDDNKTLLAVLADNSTHRWGIDVETLQQKLKSSIEDCLPAVVRTLYLDETEACAKNAFALCQSGYGRMPAPAKLPKCAEDQDLSDGEDAPSPVLQTSLFATHGASEAKALPWVKDLGADGRRVNVVVLPGDAQVNIHGAIAQRQSGAVEILGKKGQIVKLRVSKAGEYLEQEVTIQDSGATPPLLDLNPKILAGSAGVVTSR